MEYYIGQIFEEMYPSEAADWCNENNAKIAEIDPITKEVEETWTDIEDGREVTHTEMVEKTLRRFQIVEIPEPPAPTEEEQRANRAAAYQAEVDPITSHIQRLRDMEQTEEIQAEIAELIAERDAKVEEIKERYPYND